MAAPLFTPATGYGTKVGNYYYVQSSPNGGQWSTTPATVAPKMTFSPTYTAPAPKTTQAPAPTTYSAPVQQTSAPAEPTFDPYDALRTEIGQGWDSYISSLDSQLGGLSDQRTAQENIVGSQYDQGVNQLGLQKTQGLQSLEKQRTQAGENQTKTLRDLSGNIKNAFQAGNIYLGSRGAGDSSAANQYAYALTKLGTKQRSDVMNQTAGIYNDINDRETNLNNIYDSETRNLAFERDQKVNQIATWFADAQNQIKQLQAQGQLSKSQDLASLSKELLNQAISQVNAINQYSLNKRSMLDQWATANAQNISQLKTNMQAVSAFSPTLPVAGQVVGQPTVDSSGNYYIPQGYGSSQDEKRKGLFG